MRQVTVGLSYNKPIKCCNELLVITNTFNICTSFGTVLLDILSIQSDFRLIPTITQCKFG